MAGSMSLGWRCVFLNLGGVGGVVGIELLPLAINLPLESLYLSMSLFCFVVFDYFFLRM